MLHDAHLETRSDFRVRTHPALIAALFAAPAVAVVGRVVGLPFADKPEGMIGLVAADPGRSDAGAVLALFAALLFVPAALALRSLLAERASRLAAVGASLAVVGAMSMAVVATLQGVAGQLARHDDATVASQLWTRIWNDSPLAKTWLGILAGALGFLILAVATWRHGGSRTAAILIGLGGFFTVVTGPGPDRVLNVVSPLLLLVGFALLARRAGGAAYDTSSERLVPAHV